MHKPRPKAGVGAAEAAAGPMGRGARGAAAAEALASVSGAKLKGNEVFVSGVGTGADDPRLKLPRPPAVAAAGNRREGSSSALSEDSIENRLAAGP